MKQRLLLVLLLHSAYLPSLCLGETRPNLIFVLSDDIAQGVRYLLGAESGWVTGQILSIDGGIGDQQRQQRRWSRNRSR